eukprot:4207398-Amphidinium_carterae.1
MLLLPHRSVMKDEGLPNVIGDEPYLAPACGTSCAFATKHTKPGSVAVYALGSDAQSKRAPRS